MNPSVFPMGNELPEEYSKYFSGKSWYSINPNYNYSDDDSNLNSIEVKNVQFILNAERN